MTAELYKAQLSAPCDLEEASVLRIVEVDQSALDVIRRMNRAIFGERRIINTFDRKDLLMLMAYVDEEPAGFKIGYRENRRTFYSAKGGVMPAYRGDGLARTLLHVMMECAREKGFVVFAYDTFPNMHPGMTILGLREEFQVTRADFNTKYRDYRLRFEKKL